MIKSHHILRSAVTALALAVSSLAQAAANPNDTIILGADFPNGQVTYTEAINPLGTSVTFTTGLANQKFEKKSQAGYTGVGLTGKTGGEIDIGESLKGSFAKAVQVTSFSLNLLFDGPEYSDMQEVAQVTAHLFGSGSLVGKLKVTGDNTALWTVGDSSLPGSFVTALYKSPFTASAVNNGSGAWKVSNPFGHASITSLDFTAITGECKQGNRCSNQSDFALNRIDVAAPVPEPETYALMAAGLFAVAFVARRRRAD